MYRSRTLGQRLCLALWCFSSELPRYLLVWNEIITLAHVGDIPTVARAYSTLWYYLSHSMLVDCCMICCRECGPIAAVWRWRPPWWSNLIASLHVTSPPTPSPTTNQPPTQPNISANIRRMRTFQLNILCQCMLRCWLYSVETDLNKQRLRKVEPTHDAACSVRSLS